VESTSSINLSLGGHIPLLEVASLPSTMTIFCFSEMDSCIEWMYVMFPKAKHIEGIYSLEGNDLG
jgi:hypothetical protein